MFDLLKNKFKNFTDKIFGKAKEKAEEEPEQSQTIEEPLAQEPISETKNLPEVETISVPEVEEPKEVSVEVKEEQKESTLNLGQPEIPIEESIIEEPKLVVTESEPKKEHHSIFEIFKPKTKPQPTVVERPIIKKEIERAVPTPRAEIRPTPVESTKPIEEIKVPKIEERQVPKEQPTPPLRASPSETGSSEDLTVKKSTEIKKSFITSVKSIFTSKVKLSDKEISEFLEEFELSLLEADVSIVSAENICKDLKEKLVSASFSKDNPLEDIKVHIRESLKTQLDIDCDINNYITKTKKENQPFIIMFIGPNGAGKTTTISKFAYHYKTQNKSVVLASGDTFRAGSIDQLEKHANTIGVKIVKQNYGSDPAAVAYDAVTSAKAGKIDYVFIDTAGRQENNINLMQELKKIKKVVNPNLTIYIGEAQAGQAIVDQVSGFEKEIGVDGVILTKIDTDPKGGVAISILNELKKPIFYVGTGQTYEDLEVFSPEFIIDRIVI